MTKIPVLAVALSVLWPSASALAVDEAAFGLQNAADLGALCSAREGEPRAVAAMHMCQGYLVGLHHFHAASSLAEGAAPLYCLETGSPPTRQQAAAAFAAWVERAPESADLSAIEGAVRWAAESFPCD